MYAKIAVQCDGLVDASLVVWRFGWETRFWTGRLAAIRGGPGASNIIEGMVVRRGWLKYR